MIGEICKLQNDKPTCISVCGDGIATKDEECDDGDKNDNNGCSNLCLVNLSLGVYKIIAG